MRRFFLMFFLLCGALVSPVHAQTPAPLQVGDLGISYLFGQPITFNARFTNLPGAVTEAYLLFRADGEAATRVFPITIAADGLSQFTYAFQQGPLRPFALVRYKYQVKLQDGQELSTEEFSFLYTDNRFPWQEREASGVKIHWYAGDEAFGQSALDAARQGLQRTQQLLLNQPSAPINVYIYASTADLQQALEIGGIPWVGGHASPDLRVSLVSIAPGPEQGLEMDREIPHELAHILTYDLTRENYTKLPVWLREGIASRAEFSTNPDYSRALALAAKNNTLIAFTQLCGSFPADSASAFLAYAQSEAFTRYIIDQYGQSGLMALIQAYADGLDCEKGASRALGQNLTQIQANWQTSTLGANPSLAALNAASPYLVLLGFVTLITLVNAFFFKGARYDPK